MVSAKNPAKPNAKRQLPTSLKNPAASLKKPAGNVIHIGGTPVEFPYQPYGTQLAFMGRVISTLDRALRDGHCHALLESPTGTGKSLSLLCSTLAWQQNFKLKGHSMNPSQAKPAPEAFTDPLNYGGGFVPEVEPSRQGNAEADQPTAEGNNKAKNSAPRIFYSSRTHSQISQVIREYRKTSYRVPMAVLASRKHYCTNPLLRGKENLDEECKLLLRNRVAGCSEFKNVNKVKAHPSLQKGGCHEAHDIEDLVKVGEVIGGCSYYAARSMAEHAQLVFCPYSYIVNPVIRGAMDVNIKGAILIFDEAHNMEDIAREAGSVDIEEDILQKLQNELAELCPLDASIYEPLYEMTQDLMSWLDRRKDTLEQREFQHYVSCWTGDKALKELQEANVSQASFPALFDCATKAIKAATDLESEVAHLSGMSVLTLEGLFSALTYFFCRNGSHVSEYQLAIQRYMKRDARTGLRYSIHCLSLWCLNPAVVFKDLADLSLSVILTSGTLSPMNSFSSELGVQFGTSLEAPHVIDIKSQVWAGIISTGSGDYPLNASYKTADGYAFQDALGKSLEEILKIVPAGSLVFFPSYKLMEKLCKRWRETDQWSKLGALKSLFIEPRAGNQDDFEQVLKGYYNAVRRGSKPVIPRKKRLKKQDVSQSNELDTSKDFKKEGAALFGVCRGKVSEGIDFSDDNARAVIVVGIPFPNVNDIQVVLKKRYNDTFKSSKNLLSGSEWYCQQAFRALNQAAGRCIRHVSDYGAIIFLDERYREERNRVYISKWLRNSIQLNENFDLSVESLRLFFRDVKERVKNLYCKTDQLECCNVKEEMVTCTKNAKVLPIKKNQIINKFVQNSEKPGPYSENPHSSPRNCQGGLEARVEASTVENISCKEYIDLESDFEDVSCGRMTDLSSTIQQEDPDICIVKETPFSNGSLSSPSSGSIFRDNSDSTIVHDSAVELPDQLSPHSIPPNDGANLSTAQGSTVTGTPERCAITSTSILESKKESILNSSVNSHSQKRRRLITSSVVDLEVGPCPSMVNGDAEGRIEFDIDNCLSKLSENTHSPLQRLRSNSALTSPVVDERLRVSCSLCRSPLGLPWNNLSISGSVSSSSKVHLASLLGELNPGQVKISTSIPVIISEIASVDPEIYRNVQEGTPRGSTWSEEDGCVFKTIFCPFCVSRGNCLGVQIMATDAHNTHLLNKILFYADHLYIEKGKTFEECSQNERKSVSPDEQKSDALKPIGRFSYTAKREETGGWRTTRTKLRLPRGALLSRD